MGIYEGLQMIRRGNLAIEFDEKMIYMGSVSILRKDYESNRWRIKINPTHQSAAEMVYTLAHEIQHLSPPFIHYKDTRRARIMAEQRIEKKLEGIRECAPLLLDYLTRALQTREFKLSLSHCLSCARFKRWEREFNRRTSPTRIRTGVSSAKGSRP